MKQHLWQVWGRTLPAPTLLLSSPPRSFWGCQCHRTLGQGQPRTGQAAEEVGARRMEGNPAESHFNPPGLCPCGPSAWSPLPRELCGPPTPCLMEFSTPTSAYRSSLNPIQGSWGHGPAWDSPLLPYYAFFFAPFDILCIFFIFWLSATEITPRTFCSHNHHYLEYCLDSNRVSIDR